MPSSSLYKRRGSEPKTRLDLWRAHPQADGSFFISPNDGRVPSGQRISPCTFQELFEEVRA